MESRYYDMGLVNVKIARTFGFKVNGLRKVNIGWLGGGRTDDPAPRTNSASFRVRRLSDGDFFLVKAGSQKTGKVYALIKAVAGKKPGELSFDLLRSNHVARDKKVDAYFTGEGVLAARRGPAMLRPANQIKTEMQRARQKRLEGPFDLLPGHARGIVLKKYH